MKGIYITMAQLAIEIQYVILLKGSAYRQKNKEGFNVIH